MAKKTSRNTRQSSKSAKLPEAPAFGQPASTHVVEQAAAAGKLQNAVTQLTADREFLLKIVDFAVPGVAETLSERITQELHDIRRRASISVFEFIEKDDA